MIIKDSLSYKCIVLTRDLLKRLDKEKCLFLAIIIFYLVLWVINPNNKIIAISFIVLFAVIYRIIKDIRLSVLLTYLSSTILYVGKTYLVQLIPPGVYDLQRYPNGYVISLTVGPSVIISLIMLIIIIRDYFFRKINISKLMTKTNILIFFHYILFLLSDIFVSRRPDVSLVFNLLGLSGLILYLFLQVYINNPRQFLPLIVSMFLAFIVFESVIAFNQFLIKSPLGRSLEYIHHIDPHGYAIDEQSFIFRPAGTYDHTNTLGINLAFWLIIIFVVIIKTKRLSVLTIAILGFVTLILTLSRSAWIGFAFGILFVLFIIEKIRKRNILNNFSKLIIPFIVLIVFLIYKFVFPRAINSIYSFSEGGGEFRLEQIIASKEIILAHPFFGVGNGMTVIEGMILLPKSIFGKEALDVHNWYFSLMANYGVPSFFILIVFVVLSLRPLIFMVVKSKKESFEYYIVLGFLGCVVAFFTAGLFSASNGMIILFLFLGLFNNKKFTS